MVEQPRAAESLSSKGAGLIETAARVFLPDIFFDLGSPPANSSPDVQNARIVAHMAQAAGITFAIASGSLLVPGALITYGVGKLVRYAADNILSKPKLQPRRVV